AEQHSIATPSTPQDAARGAPAQPKQQPQQAPTLQEIAALLKQEVQPLGNAATGSERQVSELGGTIEARMTASEARLEDVEIRLASLENSEGPCAGSRTETEVWDQIKALEMEDELDKWIWRVLADAKATPPVQTYIKGEFNSFNGVAFGKYSSAVERDAAVEAVRKASLEYGGQKVRTKPGQPLETRALQSVLFGVKKMLIDWGFDKKSLWADASTMSLSRGGDLVIKMTGDNKTPTIEYGVEWETYLMPDGANKTVTDLLDAAKEKLHRSSAPSKGLGKGKGERSF
ncbi:unnamed protein product, partial [Prorocentrum cordatum]